MSETRSAKGYYGYVRKDDGKGTVLTFLPQIVKAIIVNKGDPVPDWIPYYEKLDKIHDATDARHDQESTARCSSRLITDPEYRAYLHKNILQKAGFTPANYQFKTRSGDDVADDETYNLDTDSIHKLYKALLRKPGHDSFSIDSLQNSLPIYIVVESDTLKSTLPDNEYANCQVEISKYDELPQPPTDIDTFVRVTNGKNNTFKFVNDCGSSNLYKKFVIPPPPPLPPPPPTSVFSGIMDSSSTNDREIDIKQHFQVFIPFMYVLEQQRTVWLYCCPNEDFSSIDAYFSKPITYEDARVIYNHINGKGIDYNKVYISSLQNRFGHTNHVFGHMNITNIPTLPEISNYIASEGYNQRKKCIDLFIKTDKITVEGNCGPFFECAKFIFTIIGTNIKTTEKSLIDRFFMQIKHFGDRFRVIDSEILSHGDGESGAITGTCDSFLKNLFVQAEMYGIYANKGTNLVLSNIRDPPPQEAIIDRLKRTILYTYIDYNAMKTYVDDKMSIFKDREQITNIITVVDNLRIFFQNVDIFQPRGSTIRKLVSIVAAKKFFAFVNGKQIVFDEVEIQEIWKLYKILEYFSKYQSDSSYSTVVQLVLERNQELLLQVKQLELLQLEQQLEQLQQKQLLLLQQIEQLPLQQIEQLPIPQQQQLEKLQQKQLLLLQQIEQLPLQQIQQLPPPQQQQLEQLQQYIVKMVNEYREFYYYIFNLDKTIAKVTDQLSSVVSANNFLTMAKSLIKTENMPLNVQKHYGTPPIIPDWRLETNDKMVGGKKYVGGIASFDPENEIKNFIIVNLKPASTLDILFEFNLEANYDFVINIHIGGLDKYIELYRGNKTRLILEILNSDIKQMFSNSPKFKFFTPQLLEMMKIYIITQEEEIAGIRISLINIISESVYIYLCDLIEQYRIDNNIEGIINFTKEKNDKLMTEGEKFDQQAYRNIMENFVSFNVDRTTKFHDFYFTDKLEAVNLYLSKREEEFINTDNEEAFNLYLLKHEEEFDPERLLKRTAQEEVIRQEEVISRKKNRQSHSAQEVLTKTSPLFPQQLFTSNFQPQLLAYGGRSRRVGGRSRRVGGRSRRVGGRSRRVGGRSRRVRDRSRRRIRGRSTRKKNKIPI
jgi:hypothetical protein